jgi:hypothetical protein
VIGTLVNFGRMTGRALAVILKLFFRKSCAITKKVLILTGHPVYTYPFFAVIVIGYNILLWGLDMHRI